MNQYGIIMAGGGGTRFWPISRRALPKQFLNLTGNDIMVNETVNRLLSNIQKENIYIVTNESHAERMNDVTKEVVLKEHILAEPAARNTAACIGYAAIEIRKKHGDGIMCIFPSDHYIKDQKLFDQTLQKAVKLAEETSCLVTIGMQPTFAATGYGYIKYDKEETEKDFHEVVEFVEKPDAVTAESYIKGGGYLWNSGMFVWKVSTILQYFKELLPDVYACLMEMEADMGTEQEEKTIKKVYPTIPKISIDYGIMERAKEVLVIEGNFDWNDVGSWDALQAIHEKDENGNVSNCEPLLIDTKNCTVYTKKKLVTTLGVEDLIIVETEDTIMVCHKDKAQDVRVIVEELEKQGKEQYL